MELRRVGIPAHQSFSAGTYVCNTVLYSTLGYIEDHKLSIKAGFIHVPLLKSQDPDGMELETMLPRKIAFEVKLFRLGGELVVRMIEKNGYNVLVERPVVSKTDKGMIFLRALLG